jgi:hypothetical protein
MIGDDTAAAAFSFAGRLLRLTEEPTLMRTIDELRNDQKMIDTLTNMVIVGLGDRPDLHDAAREVIRREDFRQQVAQDAMAIILVGSIEERCIDASADPSTIASWEPLGIVARPDLHTDEDRAHAHQDLRGNLERAMGQLEKAYTDYVVGIVTGTIDDPKTGRTLKGVLGSVADVVQPDGTIKVPTMHPVRALFEAIHAAPSGHDWSDYDGLRSPTHTTLTGRDKAGAVYVSLRLQPTQTQPTEAELAVLWDKLRQMDQVTSDMLIYCLAACLNQPGWVWVDFTDFLKTRGIKPIRAKGEPRTWGHGYRTEQIAEAATAIDQLELLYIEMENVLLPNKKGSLTRQSPALTTRERWIQREMNGMGVACAIEVQLGTWAEAYRELDIDQFGFLAKKALEYNPRLRQPEKLIAKYLLFHHRINAKNGTFHRSILTLLTVADIKLDTVRPQQTEKRLEVALDRLREDGVIGQWRHIIDADARRARGRSRDWGKAMIEIDPPATTSAHYNRFQRLQAREIAPPRKRAAKG